MILYRKAVLLIHGFVGSTKDLEPLFFSLNHEMKFDVYNFLLPGHDEIKYSISNEDWLKATEEKMNELIKYGYHDIYVVGHSMGGLIATNMAIKYPKYVKKLVLLAPAFNYLTNDHKSPLKKLATSGTKLLKDYEFHEIINRTFKATPKMIKEFIKLVDKSNGLIEKVNCPLLIMQGNNDVVVPLESSLNVFEKAKMKNKTFVLLDKVNHDIFNSSKTELINEYIKKFLLKKIMLKGKNEEI